MILGVFELTYGTFELSLVAGVGRGGVAVVMAWAFGRSVLRPYMVVGGRTELR
jgi:hypothetical protein